MTPTAIPDKFAAETSDRLMAVWGVAQDNAMNCVLAFGDTLDEDRLRAAMRLTLDAEPILGCRWQERWFRPRWLRRDDLDHLDLCPLRRCVDSHGADRDAAVREFLAQPLDADRDFQVRAELLRGEADTLCIKLDHKVGDGQALKQYVYLLADLYTRLGADPQYRPAPNLAGDRSLRQITRQIDRAGRREIFRHYKQRQTAQAGSGAWRPPSGPALHTEVHVRHLDAAEHAAIFEYACRRGLTIYHTLIAALFMAAREAVPHSGGSRLPIVSMADLRRYLPDKTAHALCNLVGMIAFYIDDDQAESLDQVAAQIRAQVLAQRKEYFGLSTLGYYLDSHPVAGRIFRCTPYRWLKRFTMRRTGKQNGPGMLGLTDIGPLDPDGLAFDDVPLAEAYVASGMTHNPALAVLCVSTFRDTLTICSGGSHAFSVERMIDRMTEILVEQTGERSAASGPRSAVSQQLGSTDPGPSLSTAEPKADRRKLTAES